MTISDKMLEELRALLKCQGTIIPDSELLESGLAITNFVLIKQMRELQGAVEDA